MTIRPFMRAVVVFLVALEAMTLPAWSDLVMTATSRFEGTVRRIDAAGVEVVMAAGGTKISLGDVRQVDIPKPAALDRGLDQIARNDFTSAIATLQPLVEQFGTVRVPGLTWTSDAILGLGDAYLGAGKFPEAQRIYDSYARMFNAAKEVIVKQARVQIVQNNCPKALEMLGGFVDPMLKQAVRSDAEERALSEGLVLQADCLFKAGKNWEALDRYLLVVTLFDEEPMLSLEAQLKSGRVYARLGRNGRAADAWRKIVETAPQSAFAVDARKELESLKPQAQQ
jgi:tetratricopeptide (TPR) repeat protein